MTRAKILRFAVSLILLVAFSGCSTAPKSPEVADNIRKSLGQANLQDVNVSQDREKGVVTLTGTTATEAEKAEAESLAKASAGSQVVSNQIAVRPAGNEGVAKKVDSDHDPAIEK